MNSIQTQFLGFMKSSSLFEELHGLYQFSLDINEIDDFDFTKLNITQNLTLGKRVERFFEFYIMQSQNYELVKNNIQIIHNKHTLGELDFVIYDKTAQKYLHIEHIYKFYLYDDSIVNEIDRYIGPNRNDTFDRKLEKLINKQLPLLYKEETKEYLQDINIDEVEQKVCFKGKIYLPLDFLETDIPIINDACISGFYLNYEEFISKERFQSLEYFLPEKFDWVCHPDTNKKWYSFNDILDDVEI
ncbi:MAG: DUF1853 family protein, partial [Arcobacteraceae bacterium]